MRVRELLRADGIAVHDILCTAGPHTRPFEEAHGGHSVAYVRRGSFGYACQNCRAELLAGGTLLGRPGDGFTCTHEHSQGDACLSIQFSPERAAELAETAAPWRRGALPPLPATVALGELLHATATGATTLALEEAALLYAGRAIAAAREQQPATSATPTERRRAVAAAQWIEAHAAAPIDLAQAAAFAGLSRFHFLRGFTRVLGITPHQHLLRARLRHAAALLIAGASVTEAAMTAGVGDLSQFTRRFRQATGIAPGGFRALAREDRNNRQARLARAALA